MELDLTKAAELRIKNLEMIQGVVSRMAAQATTAKNYCVTLTTAVFGFSVTLHRPSVAFLALVPIIAFGALDARFLSLERCFRALFKRVQHEDWKKMPMFDLEPGSLAASDVSYFDAAKSWSVAWFYLPLGVSVILVALIAEVLNGNS